MGRKRLSARGIRRPVRVRSLFDRLVGLQSRSQGAANRPQRAREPGEAHVVPEVRVTPERFRV